MTQDSTEEWENDEVVLVLPGLPANLSRPDGARYVYPSTTIAFVKTVRTAGVPIELAVPRSEAVFVSHNAADLWMPILQLGLAMVAGAGGNLISSLVESAFARIHEPARVHLDWRVKDSKGNVHRFKYDGPVRLAKDAALLFERSLNAAEAQRDE